MVRKLTKKQASKEITLQSAGMMLLAFGVLQIEETNLSLGIISILLGIGCLVWHKYLSG